MEGFILDRRTFPAFLFYFLISYCHAEPKEIIHWVLKFVNSPSICKVHEGRELTIHLFNIQQMRLRFCKPKRAFQIPQSD